VTYFVPARLADPGPHQRHRTFIGHATCEPRPCLAAGPVEWRPAGLGVVGFVDGNEMALGLRVLFSPTRQKPAREAISISSNGLPETI
jgi:hypothetical protein